MRTGYSTDATVQEQNSCCGYFISFLIFVFTCIALTHSDNDIVYDSCGHTLRILMMVNALVYIALLILFCFVFGMIESCLVDKSMSSMSEKSMSEKSRSEKSRSTLAVITTVFIIIFTVGMLCLSAFTVNESVVAISNPNCTSAMSSKEGGINSPSANMGIPLLAITGFVVGVPNLITSTLLMLVILFILFAFICCCHNEVQFRKFIGYFGLEPHDDWF